jgi:hypothetical protein
VAAPWASGTEVRNEAGRVHLGGRAMLTAWLNRVAPAPAGDPTTLAQGPTGWQIPGGADVSGDAANKIAMRWVAVQVSAVQ